MSKKKVVVCTLMFSAILIALMVASLFIKKDAVSLFTVLTALLAGWKCADFISWFEKWLSAPETKPEPKKTLPKL